MSRRSQGRPGRRSYPWGPQVPTPWENPPIGLRVKARRVLNWRMQGEPEHPITPLMPFNPLRLEEDETLITLVPFGFTHLRMTYLPHT